MSKEGWTYAKAGVDIERKSKAISTLVGHLNYKRTGPGRVIDIKGQFTSLIDFEGWVLTLCTDGVGSKLLIAEALDKWDTVGIDCMAMNVNDTICVGAEPMSFVDYIAIDRPDERVTSEIGIGLDRAAEMANVDLVGGEIAVLPEIVKGVDLSGTALGFLKREDMVTGADIQEGDAIVGIRSTGVHSNGLTLARKILEGSEVSLDDKFGRAGKTYGMELLTPTEIYVRDVLKVCRKVTVTGMVDVTGGGLKNFVRLKRGMEYAITDPLAPQPIFQELQQMGSVSDFEMYKTFNMGMGYAMIMRPEGVRYALDVFGDKAKVVGTVKKGSGCTLKNLSLVYDTY
ncbi:MAG: phosphoribosylaminoimidazole synthetase [Methanomassiliicoccales archaeon PtaU1.Bin124]|nr:MAG: phosphoribosylaminoimidazole synthetase [Methanomassiliicoccales archaeon PtaU1.Bin124]